LRIGSKPQYSSEKNAWHRKINRRQVRLSKDKAESMRKSRLVANCGLHNDRPLQECADYYLPKPASKTHRTCDQTLTEFLKHYERKL
jgi:hypothetical protein